MNVKLIAEELSVLSEAEYDEVGIALERIVAFIDRIGLTQDEVTVRELTLPLDIGGGRWGRHLEFKAMLKRCGVRKFRRGADDPNYQQIPRAQG